MARTCRLIIPLARERGAFTWSHSPSAAPTQGVSEASVTRRVKPTCCHACGATIGRATMRVNTCLACLERGHVDAPSSECGRCGSH